MISEIFLKIKLKLISLLYESLPVRVSLLTQDSAELRSKIYSIDLGFGNEWIPMLREIQYEFRNSRIPTSRFLEYKSIRGPLHPNQQYLAYNYIKEIESGVSDLSQEECYSLCKILRDEEFGSPNFSYVYPQSSTLNIQHVYHIITIRKYLGLKIESLQRIYEFGGGYGNLARLIFKSGFLGEYSIFDFEMMGVLQKYYLSSAKATSSKINNLKFISNLDHFGDGIHNSFNDGSLLIATWSLSESPIEIRELLYDKILQSVSYVYITFQRNWHTVDNFEYFTRLSKRLINHDCLLVPCPIFAGNYYFMAARR